MATKKTASRKRRSRAATGEPRDRTGKGQKAADAQGPAADPSRYEKVFERFAKDLGAVKDALGAEIDRAVSGAGLDADRRQRLEEELRAQSGVLRERVEEAGREIRDAAERVQADARVRGAAGAGISALHSVAGSLRGLAERVERSLGEVRPYTAGETVEAGAWICNACGEATILAAAMVLDPCRSCGGKAFRRAR